MTAQNLIDTFTRTFHSCDAARALAILQEVDEEVLLYIPLRQAAIDLNVTADTFSPSEILLDETVLKVYSAWYWESATSRYALQETSTDHLDLNDPNWRNAPTAQPQAFYISQNSLQQVIGLLPGTATATAAGYPKVTIYATQRTVLVGATVMALTPQIRRLYVNGMRYVYALERKLDMAGAYGAIYKEDLADQTKATMQRAARVQPEMQLVKQRPGWRSRGLRRGG